MLRGETYGQLTLSTQRWFFSRSRSSDMRMMSFCAAWAYATCNSCAVAKASASAL